MNSARLDELDGLRALLAWWVVVYHAQGATFSAAAAFESGPLSFLGHGTLAVDAFMILSGFVIFFLLDREHETYPVFLLRRFLRLFPAYAVCFAAMLLLQDAYIENLYHLRPHHAPELFEEMLRDAREPLHQWPAQLALHALLLHGPIPDAWLHNSAGAFLMPAWSVSLEWQFYLVAPGLYWLLRRGRAGLASCALAMGLAYATRGAWPPAPFDAYLPVHLHLFAVGIASYFGFQWAARQSGSLRSALAWAPAAALLATTAFLIANGLRIGSNALLPSRWIPLSIWAFVFGCALAALSGAPGPLARAARRLLLSQPLRFLGEISYSTYLVHWPLMVLCTAIFRHLAFELTPTLHFLLLLAVGAPLVALASWVLHRFVERPGIALGRRWARRAEAAPTPASSSERL